ncbi:MAG: AmmeMemoRadiSam system protein B [Desulfobacterota bacterium]|nr:AmmeMemoRadiSam system protein B [Thermodesulfobacteriota bacterium]
MRPSPIAGSWYPGTKDKLHSTVSSLIDNASLPPLSGQPFAVISPHAGIQYSGQAAAYGFKALRGANIKRVILLGPSHYTPMHGIATSGVDGYETPLGVVPVDRSVCDSLAQHPLFKGPRSAEMPEHSLEMQLPFLQTVLGDFRLVPLVVGELTGDEYAAAAAAIKPYIDPKTVVVVSSDFTHYGRRFGYLPFRDNVKQNLKRLDGDAINKIIARDFDGFMTYLETTGATICGARPIGILLKLLPQEATGTLLTYYTSGDLLQDFTDSVSYASILFTVPATHN